MRLHRSFIVFVLIQTIVSCLLIPVLSETNSPVKGGKEGEGYTSLFNASQLPEDVTVSVKASTVLSETIIPVKVEKELADLQEDAGQVTEIHSSFEEPKGQKEPVNNPVVNDGLPALVIQGTVSHDITETGTVNVISLPDTATAELQQRVSSLAPDVSTVASEKKDLSSNGTAGLPPPIIILPASGTDDGKPFSDPSVDSKAPPEDSSIESQIPEPPVVRAEPKTSDPQANEGEKKAAEDEVRPSKAGDAVATEDVKKPAPSPQSSSPLDSVNILTPETQHEEIPSFSEWTQKQLEEAEKKEGQNKTQSPGVNRSTAPVKLRSKNYASPDCGAKIVSTNPEAENPSGLLSDSKDEYLINKCSTQRMWVIIELCEAILAKKIELANFELFSSSPKDFTVSLSHSYPSREWSSVGSFTAKDERTVQSFNLHPHLFGKFVKVEFNTHYGREHFCCTSLIKVYGTSEFEVLETENEVHNAAPDLYEDEDEQPIGVDMGKPAKNLFGHATDAVYSIVKKAAEVLVKSSDSKNLSTSVVLENSTALAPTLTQPPVHCTTLRHLVVCNNCSEGFFDRVYHLLSCHSKDIEALIQTPFVLDGINSSQLCSFYGLDFIMRRNAVVPLRLNHENQLDHAGYLAAMLPPEYISALCNMLAVLEGKVVLNSSRDFPPVKSLDLGEQQLQDTRDLGFKKLVMEPQIAQTCSLDTSFTSSHCQTSLSSNSAVKLDISISAPAGQHGNSEFESVAAQIKPTRALNRDDAKVVSAYSPPDVVSYEPVQSSIVPPDVTVTAKSHTEDVVTTSVVGVTQVDQSPPAESDTLASEQPVIESPPIDKGKDPMDAGYNLDNGGTDDQEPSKDLDAIFMEMKALDSNEDASPPEPNHQSAGVATTPSSVATPTQRAHTQQAQKESVFLRLSNKIKALERNMSLSGQYLEELSRRYKKQEELGRALNKTLVLLRDEVRKSHERERQKDEDLNVFRAQLIQLITTVESLQAERDSWQHKAAVISQHLVLIVIEVVMFGVVVWVCRRLPNDPSSPVSGSPHRKWSTSWRKFGRSQSKQQQHQLKRRGSLEGLSGKSETRQRRPSEEALHITGSYQDLLVQEENVIVVQGTEISPSSANTSSWSAVLSSRDQKRRRKRRKETIQKSSSSHNLNQLDVSPTVTRKISAPSPGFQSFDGSSGSSQVMRSQGLQGELYQVPAESSISEGAATPQSILFAGNGLLPPQAIPHMTAPYIQTAVSTRIRRSFSNGENYPSQQSSTSSAVHQIGENHDGDSGSSISQQSSKSRTLNDQTSSQSDQGGLVANEEKKKKTKKGGLKNMVKKFF